MTSTATEDEISGLFRARPSHALHLEEAKLHLEEASGLLRARPSHAPHLEEAKLHLEEAKRLASQAAEFRAMNVGHIKDLILHAEGLPEVPEKELKWVVTNGSPPPSYP